MNKVLLLLLFLIGCNSANGQSCDLCGEWSFDRFEYAGHITTDCEGIAQQIFKDTNITISDNYFAKTYITDNSANMFNNVNIIYGEFDSDKNAQVIFITSGDKLIEKLYKSTKNTVYLSLDGCDFYFKKD